MYRIACNMASRPDAYGSVILPSRVWATGDSREISTYEDQAATFSDKGAAETFARAIEIGHRETMRRLGMTIQLVKVA